MELIRKETVASALANLVKYGTEKLDLNTIDALYAHNQLIELFKIEEPNALPETFSGDLYKDIHNVLIGYALQTNMIEKYQVENFKAKIMGLVMPSPSSIIEKFDWMSVNNGIRKATTWLYDISVNSAYINLPAISRNLQWKYPGKDGDLVLTINSARPEKDPKEIALAAKSVQSSYPKCMLCSENIGYAGRINYPARQNLRFIPIPLNDDTTWYMQFSPYRYFNEHCIFFNEKHEPMTLGEKGFARMVELVKNVPHYFIGSNAPLPIVGGSILAHDHYQGGAKEMPEFRAKPKVQYFHPDFPGVKFSIVNWYNSVIRIKCSKEEQLVKAMTYINNAWAVYSDPKNNIIASTTAQHNAITPVVHLERGELYAEMFLRNNRTDEKHPFGIFHPGEELHHIKKEGIGVIEVMGTFILPGRLEKYVTQIRRYVAGVDKYDEEAIAKPEHPLYGFRKIIKLLMTNYNRETLSKADKCLFLYISQKCEEVLRATAVFKSTSDGFYGFQGFMRYMGMENSEFKENNSRQFFAQKRIEKDRSLGFENTLKQRNENYQPNNADDKKPRIAVLAGEEDSLIKNVDSKSDAELNMAFRQTENLSVQSTENVNAESFVSQKIEGESNQVENAPKKRGRKPKSETSENNPQTQRENAETVQSDDSVNAPKKRGRKTNAERERLRQLEESKQKQNEENSTDENQANVNEDSVVSIRDNENKPTETTNDNEPVKRKRGRPKKIIE